MLAPDLDDAVDDLNFVYNTIQRIRALFSSLYTTEVGSLDPMPIWLSDVQLTMAKGRNLSNDWFQQYSFFMPLLSLPFYDYSKTFTASSAFASELIEKNNRSGWIDVLDNLNKQLDVCTSNQEQARNSLQKIQESLTTYHSELKLKMIEVRDGLKKSEDELRKTTSKITELQTKLYGYNQEITSEKLSAGITGTTTVVKLIIPVFTAAEVSVPYLSLCITILTESKNLYNIIETDSDIYSTISELYAQMIELDKELQAIAAATSIINLLDNLNDEYQNAIQYIPRLSRIFEHEKDKISIIIEALNAGVELSKYDELLTINKASMAWEKLSGIANNMNNLPIDSGNSIDLIIKSYK